MIRPREPRQRRTFDIWQIVYIDLMTNVMIFFVVLWAVQSRPRKSGISDSVGTETVKMVTLPGDVLFSSGKSDLTDSGHEVMSKLFSDETHTVLNFDVGPLQKRMLVIHGHTDNEGQKEKNLDLGYQRALAAYREIARYGTDVPDHVVICTHADNTPAEEVPAFGGTLSAAEQAAVKEAKSKNRRITIEDKLVSRTKVEPVIGAKTLVTLMLLTAGVVAAVSFGVLAPERLASRGWGTLFFVGCFAVVVGTMMFRFWRLGEPSRHYLRWASKNTPFGAAEEAHFVGGERRRITLGDNRGEAFDFGPLVHRAVCVAIALLLAVACIDARALGLLDRFQQRPTSVGGSYCPDPEAQPAAVDPNVPGCELMRRAFALGYVKTLGQCAPQKQRAATVAPCTRRQRDEPALHYAWRLLKRSWSSLRTHTDASYVRGLQHDFGTRIDHLGALSRAEEQMLASAPHASHHLWTNLPDPGDGAFREQTCADRYRWLAHRPAPGPSDARRASRVFEHVLGQLLFEGRYEPAAGSCREFHVHWGAPLDTCQRLAAHPAALLSSASALGDVKAVLDRERLDRERLGRERPAAAAVSFQCYFEGDAAAPTTTPFELEGQPFTVEELHVAPSPAGAALYSDRYDAVARALVHGFHYGALMSDAGAEAGGGEGLQAAFAGHDFLLTRLYGLDALDLYLDAGWIATRPDLLEVYPYERHLRNYVQIFRRQYARTRGRL